MNKIEYRTFVDKLPDAEIFLICGPTGSGKTYLATAISKSTNGIVISMDNYFMDETQVKSEFSDQYGFAPQWDSPEACDISLLCKNIKELIEVGKTDLPVFDFHQNKRIGYQHVTEFCFPIIVEGLHAIRCKSYISNLRVKISTVFIDADETIRTKRIKQRDLMERGRSENTFEKRFYFIKMGEIRWINQQEADADYIIDTTDIEYNYEN